jgi:hypothetical protein
MASTSSVLFSLANMDAKQPETTHSAVSHSADISGSNIFPRVAESALEPHTAFLRYPAITHFAVLAALFTPLAAVPYLLSKKRISALSRKLDKVSTTTAALRIELESSAVERVKQRTELSATTAALRRELETFVIESAKQRKELLATATALRKELEASAIESDKQKEELSATTAALRRELRASADESAKQKEELNRTSASLEAARTEVTRLHSSIEQLHAEHEAFETTTESVQQLLQERKLTRQAEI